VSNETAMTAAAMSIFVMPHSTRLAGINSFLGKENAARRGERVTPHSTFK
jgi:hypothetical protein